MKGNTLSNLWLIGASPMAQDYARVLKALNAPFKVIGRGESSAKEFESAMEIIGLKNWSINQMVH